MDNTITVQMTHQGSLTLPKNVGQNYNWHSGDTFVLLEFEDELILCPQSTILNTLVNYIEHKFSQTNQPLEQIIQIILRQPALASISLINIMDYLSSKAEQRGLTHDIGEELLLD